MNRIMNVLPLLMISGFVSASTVVHAPESNLNLTERWKSAVSRGQQDYKSGFWIGYAIQKMMEPNEYFISGSHLIMNGRLGTNSQSPTLEELITGKKILPKHTKHLSDDEVVREAARGALEPEGKPSSQKVLKDLGIIFDVSGKQIRAVEISNVTLSVDLKGRPLIWLGIASNEQSLELLQNAYQEANSPKLKEDLLDAFGSHERTQMLSNFLRQVLQSNEPEDARAMAAYWFGYHDQNGALPLLVQVIQKDRSSKVRSEALSSITEVKTPEAIQALVTISQSAPDVKIRKEALYSLAETKSPAAFAILEKMIYGDPSLELRKEALYALAEFPSATSSLIKIAKSHQEAKIRKETLYLLAERNTKDTLELLEYLALKDGDEEIREDALYALSEVPNGEGIPALIKVARTHPDRKVRKQAVEVLGESKDPRARAALVQIVTDP